jgi:hypothetical protein
MLNVIFLGIRAKTRYYCKPKLLTFDATNQTEELSFLPEGKRKLYL